MQIDQRNEKEPDNDIDRLRFFDHKHVFWSYCHGALALKFIEAACSFPVGLLYVMKIWSAGNEEGS